MGHSQLLSRVMRTVLACMIDLRHIFIVANLIRFINIDTPYATSFPEPTCLLVSAKTLSPGIINFRNSKILGVPVFPKSEMGRSLELKGLQQQRRPQGKKAPKQINITKLKDGPTKQVFVDTLEKRLDAITLDRHDVEAA